MKKCFLFAFDFKEKTMTKYIIDFLKEHQIDWFYQYPGVLAADLFGTDEYYQLDIEDVINDRKEVYYLPDRKYHRSGLERLYPLKEKAIVTYEPYYDVKLYLENDDTFITSINACKQHVFEYYMGTTFNMGTVEDDLQRVTCVEIIA